MAYGDSASPTNWKTCATSQAWTLPIGDGAKTIYVRFKDGGNNATGDSTQTINLDQTAPTISNITSTTTDGAYKAGSMINVRITFSENVTITGTPRIKLQTNNGNKYATYSAGTGTQNIDFTYTVQDGDTTSDLDYVDTAALELNSGTIKDVANNNATLTFPTSGAAHSLGNNKNIIFDTTAPTISDLAPNNTTLSVETTSINLILATNETTTCKYSMTQNIDYASMTAFDTTNATSHSTFISGLNTGTTYTYYLKCQDPAGNLSSEASVTFQIAPEEQKISLSSIKIKIDRTFNKFKDTIHSAKNKFKLKSQDDNLANGTVKIYKGNKLWKTIQADADGAWSQLLKLKDNFSGSLKVRQYDQYGTLMSSKKTNLEVDTEKPKLVLAPTFIKHHGSGITWSATDNDRIDHYTVIIGMRTIETKEASIAVFDFVPKGFQTFTVNAYDRAGNKTSQTAALTVTW